MSYDSFLQLRREFSAQGRRLIDLSMLNPDLPPPRILLDKLVEYSLDGKNHRYSVARGVKKLREAFVFKYSDKFNVELNPETEVCVTFGTKDAISQLFHVTTNPGDTIIIPSPKYPTYTNVAERYKLNVQSFEVSLNHQQMLNEIEALIAKTKAKILLLNFPHNPSGVIVTADFYKALNKITADKDLIVYNDFVYGEMQFDNIASCSLLSTNTIKGKIESYSLSKAYSIPGWRIGAVLGDKEIVKKISEIKADLDYGVFLPLQRASTAALISDVDLVKPTLNTYFSRCSLLSKTLTDAGWKAKTPSAGASVWAQMPEGLITRNSSVFAKQLLEEHGVAITPGENFGKEYNDSIRIAAVAEEGILLKALDSIRALQDKLSHSLHAALVMVMLVFIPFFADAEQDCIRASRLVREAAQNEDAKKNQEALYREAISLCQQMSEAHHNLAVVLYEQGKYKEASVSIRKAIEYKEDATFYITLGNIELNLGNIENAEQAYQTAGNIDPSNTKALQGQAIIFDKKGDLNKALDALNESSNIDSNNFTTQINIAIINEKLGNFDQAKLSYTRALNIDNSSELANLKLGQLLQRSGDLSQSKIYFERAFELNNNNSDALKALASVLLELKDFNGAELAARKALNIKSDDNFTRLNLASALIQKADYKGAVKELTICLQSNQEDTKILTLLGFAELESGDFTEAEKYLSKAILLDASLANAHYNLGIAQEKLGKSELSKNSFKLAEQLNRTKPQ